MKKILKKGLCLLMTIAIVMSMATVVGFADGEVETKDGTAYIKAMDFDSVLDNNGTPATDITYCTDGTNGKSNYLYPTWWRTFTYENITFGEKAPTMITLYYGVASWDKTEGKFTVKIDGKECGIINPTQQKGHNVPVGYSLPVSGISAEGTHKVEIVGTGVSINFFGFEFGFVDVVDGYGYKKATECPKIVDWSNTSLDKSTSVKVNNDGQIGKKEYLSQTYYTQFIWENLNFDGVAPNAISVYLGASSTAQAAVKFEVIIDGVSKGKVSANNYSTGWNVPYHCVMELSDVSGEGLHTVQIKNANGTDTSFFGLEFFNDNSINNGYEYMKATECPKIVDWSNTSSDKSTSVKFNTDGQNGKKEYLSQTYYTQFIYDNVDFNGVAPNAISVYLGASNASQAAVKFEVIIDGKSYGKVSADNYSSGWNEPYQRIIELPDVSGEGLHTVQIKNANGTDTSFFGIEFSPFNLTCADSALSGTVSAGLIGNKLIVATFKDSGELVGAKVYDAAATLSEDISDIVGDATKIRIFTWTDLNTLTPVITPEEISIN